MTDLEKYLGMMHELKLSCMNADQRDRFTTLEAYLLERGHVYAPRALTADENDYVLNVAKRRRYPLKECFANTMKVVTDERFLGNHVKYAEGFVMRADIPLAIHHAWLDLNGAVVDLTLRVKGRFTQRRDRSLADRVAIGTFREPTTYFGMTFSEEEVVQRILQTQEYGSLLDDWKRGHPYLDRNARPQRAQGE